MSLWHQHCLASLKHTLASPVCLASLSLHTPRIISASLHLNTVLISAHSSCARPNPSDSPPLSATWATFKAKNLFQTTSIKDNMVQPLFRNSKVISQFTIPNSHSSLNQSLRQDHQCLLANILKVVLTLKIITTGPVDHTNINTQLRVLEVLTLGKHSTTQQQVQFPELFFPPPTVWD